MKTSERIELIEQAIALIEEAKNLVDDAVKGSSQEAHFHAYGRYGFDDLLGMGNPYNSSLFNLLTAFEQEENKHE